MATTSRRSTALWTSTAVLLSATAVAGAWLYLDGLSDEAPNVIGNIGLGLILLPFLALFVGVVCLVLSAVVVLPTVPLARRLGRSATGRADARWPVPATAAVEAGLVAGAAAFLGAGPGASLVCWAAVATALSAAVLTARLALRDSWRGRGVRLFLRTACGGAAAVALTVAAWATAYGTGLATVYEPPRMSPATLAGSWSDGHGGTLTLAADGSATASGLDEHDGFGAPAGDCDGTGSWEFDPGDGPSTQQTTLTLPGCDDVGTWWYVLGTEERPKLYAYRGDPDSWDLYILRRQD